MTYSFQTLQDFVMNLLNDDVAAAAYQADPLAALSDAGLGDLTPQDVQEVIPLVTDSLPSDTPLGDLSADFDATMEGASGHLAMEGGDLTSKSSMHLYPEVSTVSHETSSALGDFAAGGKLSAEEYGGSAVSSTDLGDATVGLVGHPGGVAGWGGVDTAAGDLAGGFKLVGTDFVGGLDTPLGAVAIDSSGNYSLNLDMPTDVLDGDLGNTGDAVAGTVAHYVGTGADTLSGAVESGADTLAGFLAGPVTPAVAPIETGGDVLSNGIESGADALTGQLQNLPATDSLPLALPAVPVEAPELAGNLADPQLGDLPVDLPTGDLPLALPDTSAVTDVLAHNPVTDAVSTSPVGGLTDTVSGVTDHLPVGDLTDTLDLGL